MRQDKDPVFTAHDWMMLFQVIGLIVIFVGIGLALAAFAKGW